ncbi:MAG: hypothetical protein IIA65_07975 [Planctomycetes bacterium]|nr:hypothetical protein [Planctomycetota bacterium]
MCKTNTPTTPSMQKSRFVLFVTLGLGCLTLGCSQVNTLQEQQITLQEKVDINAEKAASLQTKLEQHQQDMDTALGAIVREQRILKNRQEGLQQSVASISSHAEGMAGRIQTLSQQLSALSTEFDDGQQLMAANYENLSERENSQQDGIDRLERSRETLTSNLMSLQSEHVSLSGLADDNRKEIEALALTSEATDQAVKELAKLSDSHHEELQTISADLDQRTATLTRIQGNVEQLALNIQDVQTTRVRNEQLFLERSEELLDRIKGLQADHSQWQERLSSLQQEIGLVRDSTSTLDDKIDQLGKVDQLEEVDPLEEIATGE